MEEVDKERRRVELHVHLDGAVRHETIYSLMKEMRMQLPGDGSFEALKKALTVTEPIDLANFLRPFAIYIQVLQSPKVAERIAKEFCAEMANNNVLYAEARYSPHNFLPNNQREISKMTALVDVVKAIHKGFEAGEVAYGVKVRSILVGFNGTETVDDVLKLAQIFNREGVVGIDMATKQGLGFNPEEVQLNSQAIRCYEEARKCGIHRTVHAGESGGAVMVERAIQIYNAERIGHGYHVVDRESLFQQCLRDRIHLEACPLSSILTGAVQKDSRKKHPIIKFAETGANYSISSDDPTVTGKWVDDDYKLLEEWGLSDKHFKRANINAAKSSFLPEREKAKLVKTITDLWE